MTSILDRIEALPLAGIPVTVMRLSNMGFNVLRWQRRQRRQSLRVRQEWS